MKYCIIILISFFLVFASCSEDCVNRTEVSWAINCSNCTGFDNVNLSVGNSTAVSFNLNGGLTSIEVFFLDADGVVDYQIERQGEILKEGSVQINPCRFNEFSTSVNI